MPGRKAQDLYVIREFPKDLKGNFTKQPLDRLCSME